jgi:hypothetical protein
MAVFGFEESFGASASADNLWFTEENWWYEIKMAFFGGDDDGIFNTIVTSSGVSIYLY